MKALMLLVILLLGSAQASLRDIIDEFLEDFDPTQPVVLEGLGENIDGVGNRSLIARFIAAYNFARQIYPALPEIYLKDVVATGEIIQRIGQASELTLVTSRAHRVPPTIIEALERRLFPEQGGGLFTAYLSLARDEVPRFAEWRSREGLRGRLYVSARGQDPTSDLFGISELVGFSVLLIGNDIYLFTAGGTFFEVESRETRRFLPWLRLVRQQLAEASEREDAQ